MAGMPTEIERKWVAGDRPDVALPPGRRLRQGYLPTGEGTDRVTVRVRIVDDAVAVLTIKAPAADGGLARAEIEVPLAREAAEELWALTAGRRIDKVRHVVALTDGAEPELAAEVDLYAGELAGLCTVEVEFASLEAARRFVAPAWFGTEVTGDERWSNAALAAHGRPADP